MKEREAAGFERLELGYLRSLYSFFGCLAPVDTDSGMDCRKL
jgi:hypothetical protein